MKHLLPDGREVHLYRFWMTPTYHGVMAGSQETASRHILERLAEQAAGVPSSGTPLVVIPPSAMPLPRWQCVAELFSQRGVRQTDPDYGSRLRVCWFAKDTNRSLNSMLKEILPHLDWEQVAEDYDMMP